MLQIKSANDTMEELTEISVNRKMEHRITNMLLTVIFVFCVKSILIFICQFLSLNLTDKALFLSLRDLFVVLHCGVNIIIYGIYDKNFRKIILSRCKNDKKTTVYSKYSLDTQVIKSHWLSFFCGYWFQFITTINIVQQSVFGKVWDLLFLLHT